jgi:hypothetical protein
MQVMIERCCGLDVHQKTLVACVLSGAPGLNPTKEVRTFRTMTRELEALRAWLKAMGVTHVGMESTGVYWRPVYAVLEGHFELIVGNARHIRNVPGRKTAVKAAPAIRQRSSCCRRTLPDSGAPPDLPSRGKGSRISIGNLPCAEPIPGVQRAARYSGALRADVASGREIV